MFNFNFLKNTRHLFTVFLCFQGFVIIIKHFFNAYNIDIDVLRSANIILFIISIISMNLQIKGMKNDNPNSFVRAVVGSMMIKMFIIVGIILVYVVNSNGQFNKKGIFISLFFYLIYLAAEVTTLMKLNKK